MEGAAGPPACDDPWPRRFRKRLAAVDHIKKTAAYAAYHADAHPDIDVLDPQDRTISKRQWERLVQKWRAHLRGDALVTIEHQERGQCHRHVLVSQPVRSPSRSDADSRVDAE